MSDELDIRASVPSAPSVLWVLIATLISGVSGYLVMWLVARALGAADYSVFGVFWSALFLIVGVLFGIQQETTRATASALMHPTGEKSHSSLWLFAAGVALVVGIVVALSGLWWAPRTLGTGGAGLIVQVALGSGANAVVATLSGMLAGARLWRHLGAIIASDGVVRLVAIFVALALGGNPAALAWAVIIPFPIALGLVFLFSPGPMIRYSGSPLSYRRLISNSGQTMLAASATALIINGFPLMLAFFAEPTEKAKLGALILAITITRAPVLVPLMALQSYLVTRFTGMTESMWPLIGRSVGLIGLVMAVLAGATFLWGTAAFASIVGVDFALSTGTLVPLVVSSGFIGSLCVTGPALLASGRHRGYALGWVVASAVSVGALFLPVGLEVKAPLALSIGPIIGLVVHLGLLRVVSDRRQPTTVGLTQPGSGETGR